MNSIGSTGWVRRGRRAGRAQMSRKVARTRRCVVFFHTQSFASCFSPCILSYPIILPTYSLIPNHHCPSTYYIHWILYLFLHFLHALITQVLLFHSSSTYTIYTLSTLYYTLYHWIALIISTTWHLHIDVIFDHFHDLFYELHNTIPTPSIHAALLFWF